MKLKHWYFKISEVFAQIIKIVRRWVWCLITFIKTACGLETVRKPSEMCVSQIFRARLCANSVYAIVRKSDKWNNTRKRRNLVVKAPSLIIQDQDFSQTFKVSRIVVSFSHIVRTPIFLLTHVIRSQNKVHEQVHRRFLPRMEHYSDCRLFRQCYLFGWG